MDFGSGFGALIGFTLLVPVALLGVVILGIVAVAGGREPDPTGQRQRATYLAAICFVSLITVLFAGYAAVTSVTDLIGDDEETISVGSSRAGASFSDDEDGGAGFSFGDDDDESDSPIVQAEDDNDIERAVSGAMAGLVVLAAAGALYVFHRRLMQELIDLPGFATGPSRRALNGYAYATSFVAALIALGAAAAALYGLYRVLLPDFSAPDGDGERMAGLRQLVSSAALALASLAIFQRHFNLGERWTRPLAAPAVETGLESDTEPPPVA